MSKKIDPSTSSNPTSSSSSSLLSTSNIRKPTSNHNLSSTPSSLSSASSSSSNSIIDLSKRSNSVGKQRRTNTYFKKTSSFSNLNSHNFSHFYLSDITSPKLPKPNILTKRHSNDLKLITETNKIGRGLTDCKSFLENPTSLKNESNRNNVLSSQTISGSSSNSSIPATQSTSSKKLNKSTNLNDDNQTDLSVSASSSTLNNSPYIKKNFLEQLKLEKRYNVKKLSNNSHNSESVSDNLSQLSGFSKLTLENSLLKENKDIYSAKLNLNETSDDYTAHSSNSNTQSKRDELDSEKYDNNSDDSCDVESSPELSLSSSRLDQEDLSSSSNIVHTKANSQPINHTSISAQLSSDGELNICESNNSQSNCNISESIRNTHSMSSRNIYQMHRPGTPSVDTNNLGRMPSNLLTQSVSLNSSSFQCCHNHSCHHSHFATQRMEMNSNVPITSFRQQQLANQKNLFELGMSSIQASTIISNHCNTDHSTNPSNLTAVTKLTSSSSGLPVSTLTVMESPNLSSFLNAGYNWQAFMPTLKNRMATIFNCELLADIHFIVGKGNAQTRFPAHKFVLSIGSAVFDAMFNGLLTKTNYCNNESNNGLTNNKEMEIELPDIEPDAFKALLRFLYLDEVQIDPETVMTTLYAAKKYEVPALEIACVDFLKANLSPENAFMLLTQARLFDEATLADLCLETIDKHTMDALYSDSFYDIDLDTLKLVLSRDSLRVREVSLFIAVLRWAEVECSRNLVDLNSENKRKALGDALYLLRFPLMSIEEFAVNAAQSGLLTDKEIVNLFLYFTVSSKPSVPFSIEPRCSITGHECTVNRFQRTESRWGYSGTSDRIRFLTDRPIFLIGFGLFGSIHGPSEYEVIIEIIHTGSGKMLASNTTSFLSDGSDSTFRVMFKYPVEITQNTNYTACATLKGLDSYYGTNGCRTVTVNLGKGVTKDNVTFQFSYAAGCNNGTSVEDGQIPELIFYT